LGFMAWKGSWVLFEMARLFLGEGPWACRVGNTKF
jgi:hypothetical protein